MVIAADFLLRDMAVTPLPFFTTVTLNSALALPGEIVIVAEPFLTPFILPFCLTVATDVSLLSYLKFLAEPSG